MEHPYGCIFRFRSDLSFFRRILQFSVFFRVFRIFAFFQISMFISISLKSFLKAGLWWVWGLLAVAIVIILLHGARAVMCVNRGNHSDWSAIHGIGACAAKPATYRPLGSHLAVCAMRSKDAQTAAETIGRLSRQLYGFL